MKDKILVAVVCFVFIAVGLVLGYFTGYNVGLNTGNTTGFELGKVISYEKGYISGYDNGKEYVVTHLDQYVAVPKAVSYDEVVEFLKEDKTSDNEYSTNYDCIIFTSRLKENANKIGIKCASVILDMYDSKNNSRVGHAINAFDTSDKGIVYFDPQTDQPRYNVEVGNYYNQTQYKITQKVLLW